MPLLRKLRRPVSIPFVIVKRHTADGEWSKYLGLWNVSIEQRLQ